MIPSSSGHKSSQETRCKHRSVISLALYIDMITETDKPSVEDIMGATIFFFFLMRGKFCYIYISLGDSEGLRAVLIYPQEGVEDNPQRDTLATSLSRNLLRERMEPLMESALLTGLHQGPSKQGRSLQRRELVIIRWVWFLFRPRGPTRKVVGDDIGSKKRKKAL